jgi:hypothetical protein
MIAVILLGLSTLMGAASLAMLAPWTTFDSEEEKSAVRGFAKVLLALSVLLAIAAWVFLLGEQS